ncbi:gamma-glutamyl-gamma-aminobutyrate hydrolase family protein [Terrilactibacillus laevilacticus]|uniref:gamma-glutamyl-gamma-aminobutyrate hydrolase family protein n=1 Tax=Terrilactibacillus laevilacticus TaxID=1380157 RepID=UPI001146C889|nr:gamma-glutamyl-gamma-aminobutyrate hydrolase family protein [Terrilactibacillus laevilacticus]
MNHSPIVGITSFYLRNKSQLGQEGVYVNTNYHEAVLASGGIPIVIPTGSPENAAIYIKQCDGIIFSGGEDIDPKFYHEDPSLHIGSFNTERDEFEFQLFREALKKDIPVFGICRGMQVINVALGGSLIQDIPSQCQNPIRHAQTIKRGKPFHSITIDENSHLYDLFQTTHLEVNSHHHQAIKDCGKELRPIARASDGTIEAIEHKQNPNVMAVQWHPEAMFYEKSDQAIKLFNYFISKCQHPSMHL